MAFGQAYKKNSVILSLNFCHEICVMEKESSIFWGKGSVNLGNY